MTQPSGPFSTDIVSDQVAPPWLQVGARGEPGVGGRYLQTCGLALDAIATRALNASIISMPGVGDPSGLPYIGLDRVIMQGALEADTAYATRLTESFDAWRVSGSAWGVLWQVLSLFAGYSGGTPSGRTVSSGASPTFYSTWDYYGTAANLTVPPLHFTSITNNWNWDNNTEVQGTSPGVVPWYRYWLIIDSGTWTTDEGNWGDAGNWGDGTASWGLSVPPAIFQSIRTVLRSWQAANAWCRWIVIPLTTDTFEPDAANAEPDGTWGPWWALTTSGAVNTWVQSRSQSARYADGLLPGS